MKELALFVLIWLFSTELSAAAGSRLGCSAERAKDYDRIEFGCTKGGQECEIHCRKVRLTRSRVGACKPTDRRNCFRGRRQAVNPISCSLC